MAVVRRRSSTPQAPNYSRAQVEALSNANAEPAWLRERRLEAWQTYEATPMPQLEEEWRRTDYRHIRWDEAERMINANGATADAVPAKNLEPLTGDEQGGLLVFVDGKLVHYQLADALARQGVVFTDLRSAVTEHEALVEQHLMTRAVQPADGKFAALHAALWDYGVFVHVPRNIVAELPLHVVCFNTEAGTALGHVLVVLEDNAPSHHASRIRIG